MTGSAKCESVFIPRIPMIPSDYPFQFKRMQFPVKVCFAMTINKSQGQTLKIAGIDPPRNCLNFKQEPAADTSDCPVWTSAFFKLVNWVTQMSPSEDILSPS
ncbi:hypothetical protein QTP88_016332 [Uroleucon formosanum]